MAVRLPTARRYRRHALPPDGISLKDAVSNYERAMISSRCTCGGVQKRAAELLQVKPTTLNEMMKRLSISTETVGVG